MDNHNVYGRLQHIEGQVESLAKDVDALKQQREILIRLESKVDQTSDFIRKVSDNGGFNRCVERGQIIGNINSRVKNLESGNTPEAVQTRAEIEALRREMLDTQNELTDLGNKITPLEKRVLMWVGAISAGMFLAPLIVRYIKM
ncbi:hypothetical protein [Desulfoluna butyratoxydans]|uniref:Uncharacterized protein n=1 Tax=Desulfoluna butyratoxydans TaxID=231438 RepID=A0A4U8YRG5_9BACT|nr:hypothetical protein [Desulfoluna butyratoxydans]VFQ43863.1 hypothetical protein MSL71_15040 [Desulfoluna butyratoxydans]